MFDIAVFEDMVMLFRDILGRFINLKHETNLSKES